MSDVYNEASEKHLGSKMSIMSDPAHPSRFASITLAALPLGIFENGLVGISLSTLSFHFVILSPLTMRYTKVLYLAPEILQYALHTVFYLRVLYSTRGTSRQESLAPVFRSTPWFTALRLERLSLRFYLLGACHVICQSLLRLSCLRFFLAHHSSVSRGHLRWGCTVVIAQ